MISDFLQQSVFKRCHSDKHLSDFLPTRWRQKSTGIVMEQNDYVTVTLYVWNTDWSVSLPLGLPIHDRSRLLKSGPVM